MRESEKYPVGTLIGGRDCGKTTYMIGNDELNVEGYVPKKVMEQKLKGVIVIDTQLARDSYRNVKKIKHPSQYVSGAVHLIVTAENRDEMVEWIRLHVTDTFILFEDARNIVPIKIGKTPYEALIIDSKNIHCPVWFQYHGWMAVPKELYTYLDILEIFKIKQHPKNRKSDITNYDEVVEVYERVKNHPNPFHHETVNNEA